MDFKEKAYNVFQMFNDDWALATAGSVDDFNTMTIAWGSISTTCRRRSSRRRSTTWWRTA